MNSTAENPMIVAERALLRGDVAAAYTTLVLATANRTGPGLEELDRMREDLEIRLMADGQLLAAA